jgi:hypothetical protein
MALALTATLVIGGLIGYVIGRPSQSPALSGELPEGEIRVPDVTGLSLGDARLVLGAMRLDIGSVNRMSSSDQPRGIVLTEQPAPGTAVRTPGAVKATISSGPGPAVGPTYLFARSVLIPIRRSGPFSWTSEPVAMDGPPVSLGANTRAIGAETSPYRISSAPVRAGTAISVKFDVKSFHKPAWFVILKAFGRQRESAAKGSSLRVTPHSGPAGTLLMLEGQGCGSSDDPTTVVEWHVQGTDGTERLPIRASSYAFRIRLRLPRENLRPGAAVTIRAGPRCRGTFQVTG